MIYTSYEMVRDCRNGSPEGWRYFVTNYVPVVRRLLKHYFPGRAGDEAFVKSVLHTLAHTEFGLFHSLEPVPERAFVAKLRQHVLAAAEADRASAAPAVLIDIETLGSALEPLTLTEKLAVWFETMRYSDADAGRMLRMSAQTAEKIRARAAEMVRGAMDAWRSTMLAENGGLLGRAVGAGSTQDCLPAKAFFDVIDGRTTWGGREEMERHVRGCWHCLDHYCRLLEVVDVLRGSRPLADEEAEACMRMLGFEAARRGFWKG